MIAIADADGDMIHAVKAANESGVTTLGDRSVVAMALLLEDVHSLGLPVAQNIYTIESVYWDADDKTRQFAQRFCKLDTTSASFRRPFKDGDNGGGGGRRHSSGAS